MKRLILLELILLFLATTFRSDSAGGWVQQTIPIGSKSITDIQFLDSLNGWVVTNWNPAFDTSYILKTSDGGSSWTFQYRYPASFTAISMVNSIYGYASGGTGFGRVFKTTNSGLNWDLIYTGGHLFTDIFFVDQDTGWICDDDGFVGAGLLKTTNGGVNWSQQLTASSQPSKLFFLNKDTGWAICQTTKLLRTIDGGGNWTQQYAFGGQINDVCFRNANLGWVSGGVTFRTVNGGFNWTAGNDGGIELSFVNDSIGWGGNNSLTIIKTTNSGINWFRQATNLSNPSVSATDSLNAWAGGGGIVHTTDGGGPPVGIQQISSDVPNDFVLYQNYPNPFNPKTTIKYQITASPGPSEGGGHEVSLIVFDITGKEIITLVNQKQNPGTYEVDFDGTNLSSGIYFYQLIVSDGQSSEADPSATLRMTKRMVLIK